MILLVVDRPRYGLVEQAVSLQGYLAAEGLGARVLVTGRLPDALQETGAQALSFRRLFARDAHTVVILSMGACYLAILALRLCGRKVIVVVHEPGGYRQKIARGDAHGYAFRAALYETLARLASLRGTPNRRNAVSGRVHLPLILAWRGAAGTERDTVVYLGRKEPRRAIRLFRSLARRRAGGHAYAEFPTAGRRTTRAKDRIMARALAVVNLYRVPHNQSGVTADAIRYGVPVIVSEHDAWADLIRAESLGLVLPADGIRERAVLGALDRIARDPGFRANMSRVHDREFGAAAFRTLWLPHLRP